MPVSNELVPMSQYLSSPKMKNYLQSMLGNNINNFVTSLSSLTGSNPKLNECTRETLLGCALKATGMNLPFDQNLGFAWVVPFRDNRANSTVAQFQIGTKGFIQLALRSKQVTKLNAFDVREGEYKGRDRFGDIRIEFIEDDDERESKPVIGYAAAIQLTNGFEKTIYWNMAKLKNHAMTYSQSYRFAESDRGRKDSIWHTNFDAMAKKTIINWAFKSLPKTGISDDMLKTIEAEADYEREDFEAWKKHQEQQQADAFTQDGKFTPYEEVTNETNQ